MSSDTSNAISPHMSKAAASRRASRQSTEVVFRSIGLGSLMLAAGVLVWLMWGIIDKGRYGFTQHMMELSVYIDPEPLRQREGERDSRYRSRLAKDSIYRTYLAQASSVYFDEMHNETLEAVSHLFSDAAAYQIRDGLRAGEHQPGDTVTMWALMDDLVDVYQKGLFPEEAILAQGEFDETNVAAMKHLAEVGALKNRLYLGFPRLNLEIWLPFIGKKSIEVAKGAPGILTSPDSSNPEMAGLGRGIQGTILMLLVVIAVAVPLGVAAAIYLEEFAPKNRFTDLIEININNLAAVPSIIFGVLGLGVLINLLFPFATGWPIIGGLVLSFMTLPTVIISSRAAILAVPSSYKEAAIGLGASRMQAVFQHVLPAALPGIVSGVIIGIAQAAGETAPLLPIGMKTFALGDCTDGLGCLFQTGTAMPAQIFFWAEHAERLFKFKANAAIIVLLVLILSLNAIATYIRWRAERNK